MKQLHAFSGNLADYCAKYAKIILQEKYFVRS